MEYNVLSSDVEVALAESLSCITSHKLKMSLDNLRAAKCIPYNSSLMSVLEKKA